MGFLLAFVLILLTGLGVRSAYLLLFALIFLLISVTINTGSELTHNGEYAKHIRATFGCCEYRVDCIISGHKWFYVHFASQLIPMLYYFYLLGLFYSAFLPTVGRDYEGQSTSPDVMIAIITGLFALLTMGLLAPTIIFYKNRTSILCWISFVFILFQVLIWTSVGFPYSDGKQTQRYNVWVSGSMCLLVLKLSFSLADCEP